MHLNCSRVKTLAIARATIPTLPCAEQIKRMGCTFRLEQGFAMG